jgi:hypothetical protein
MVDFQVHLIDHIMGCFVLVRHPRPAVPLSVYVNCAQAICLAAFSSGFSRERPGFSSYMGEYQRFEGFATDPLSGFEHVNNLSLFPNPYNTILIIDERNVVAAAESIGCYSRQLRQNQTC